MSNPSLYMLVGLPASGKTTWAMKFIDSNPSAIYLSTDKIIEDIGISRGYSTYNEAFANVKFDEAQKEFNRLLKEAYLNEKTIVWDQTNLSKKSRMNKLKAVPKSYTKYAVVFNIAEEKRVEYANKRFEETGKHISHDIAENMKKDMDTFFIEEGFTQILYIF